jgi:hypothetical protein
MEKAALEPNTYREAQQDLYSFPAIKAGWTVARDLVQELVERPLNTRSGGLRG